MCLKLSYVSRDISNVWEIFSFTKFATTDTTLHYTFINLSFWLWELYYKSNEMFIAVIWCSFCLWWYNGEQIVMMKLLSSDLSCSSAHRACWSATNRRRRPILLEPHFIIWSDPPDAQMGDGAPVRSALIGWVWAELYWCVLEELYYHFCICVYLR